MDDRFVSGVLRDYTVGAIPRSVAMQRLGIDWYGDLLVMLNRYGLPRPQVAAADLVAMDAIVKQVFEEGVQNGG